MKKLIFLTILVAIALCCAYGCKVEEKQHTHDYSAVTVNPTCTQRGYVHHECSCGDSYDDNYTEALGHDIVLHEGKDVTCEESGYEAYETCSRCDYTTYKEIPATGHDIKTVPAKDPTCTEIGWDEYEFCSHCDYTTYKEIPATGHDLTVVPAKDPTCTEIGWYEYEFCSHCGYTTYEEIAALGHNIEHISAKDPTCTEAGWEAYDRCTRCGYTTDIKIIPATGHDLTHYDAKGPTCLEHGWAAYDVCSHGDYNSYEEIAALGHDFTQYDVDDIGHSRHCTRCNLHEEGEHEWKNNVCVVCKYAVDYSAGLLFEEIIEGGHAVAYSVAGRGKATDSRIIIPSVYNNLPVTAISDRAFYGNGALIGVTIPESITRFGEECFAECGALQRIDYNAVGAVFAEDNTTFRNSGNADIGITVYIGAKVPEIPAYIFNGVANVRKVVFADDSTCSSVEQYAFAGCSLADFPVPVKITKFSTGAFKDNTSLKAVYYGGNLEEWLKITFEDGDSNPLKYGNNLYIEGELLVNLTIPQSVSAIKNYAFMGCSIQSLTLGEQITSIGVSAFDSCCNMLEINYNAKSCSGLTSSTYVFSSVGADSDGVTLNIGENVTAIPAYLFHSNPDPALASNITKVIFPKNGVCTTIQRWAFAYCCNIVEVDLGNVEIVGNDAFINCSKLETVKAGIELTQIGQQAFMDCSQLKRIEYAGTHRDWLAIEKGDSVFFRVSCIISCSDVDIAVDYVGGDTEDVT